MISLMALALAATDQVTLQPIEKWVLDHQDNMCVASRTFGSAENATVFALKPALVVDGSGQILYILTSNASGPTTRRGQATITLLPSGAQRTANYVSWVPNGTKYRAYQIEGDPDLTVAMAQSTGLSIMAGKDQFALATGPFQPAFDALKKCNDTVFEDWGLNPAALAKPLAGTHPEKWFPQNSYPAAAKARHETGRSVILLTISADGRATYCRVMTKASPDLDAKACELAIKNGRYEPVSDSKGRYAVLAIRWELWR